MLKGKSLTGKEISAYNSGEEIDRVEAPISHPQHNQIVGFTVQKRGFRRKIRALPWSGIHAVTPKGIIARSQNMIVEVEQLFQIKQLLDNRPLMSTRLATTNGYDLGLITDIYFDAWTGAIEGYEVSGGKFANAAGLAFVPALKIVRFDRETMLLPPFTVELMQVVGRRLNVEGQQGDVEAAMGCRVQREVRAQEGWWVAAPTQIVTNRVIERAKRYHKERELLDSIGLDTTFEARWKDTKNQVPVLPTDQKASPAKKKMDEKRIKQALGQVAHHNVADQHGNIILAEGARITPQAILNAKNAGLLEVLLLAAEISSNRFWLPQVPRVLETSDIPLDWQD